MRRALVAFVALLLAACGGRDRAALQAEVERLRADRDKFAKIAEHLDDYKSAVAQLAEDSARVERMGVPLSHEDRIKKALAVPGVTGKRVNPYGPSASMSPWELTGTGNFDALQDAAGALAIERLTFTPAGWVVNVPAWDPGTTWSPPVAIATPVETPVPGRFETNRTKALRAEIAALERECAELQRLIGEVTAFEQKKAALDQNLHVLDNPTRLHRVATLARPLFLDASPACSQGSLIVAQQSIRFWCKPSRGTDLEASSTSLRELLGAIEGWKVGTISLDESAAEPLQGTLTPSQT